MCAYHPVSSQLSGNSVVDFSFKISWETQITPPDYLTEQLWDGLCLPRWDWIMRSTCRLSLSQILSQLWQRQEVKEFQHHHSGGFRVKTRYQETWHVDNRGFVPFIHHLTIPVELLSCSRRVHGLHGDKRVSSLKNGSASTRWSDGRAHCARENRMCKSLVTEVEVTKDGVAGGWAGAGQA